MKSSSLRCCRNFRTPLVVFFALGMLLLSSGCGMFESPYDIRMDPPPEGTAASELLPEIEGMTPLNSPSLSPLVLDAAEGYAFGEYEGDATFGVLRFGSKDVALEVSERMHKQFEANRRSRVALGNQSWSEASGQRYQFLWTNHEWVFMVNAPSKAVAEPILMASEYLAGHEDS